MLTSMNNLAATLRDQGDLAGARATQEQVLALRRRVLGEEQFPTAHLNEQLGFNDAGARRPRGRSGNSGTSVGNPLSGAG